MIFSYYGNRTFFPVHVFVECIESKNFYFEIRNWLEQYSVNLPQCDKHNIIRSC